MALKLGSLFVSLDANASGLTKGLAEGMKAVEKFSGQAKKMAGEVAQSAGVLSALGIAAVKLASTVDGPAKQAMTGLENSTKLLAVQVADVLTPAVRALTEMFTGAARVVAGLDAETKKAISTVAIIAVQLAAGAKAAQLFFGAVAPLMKALAAGVSLIGGIGVAPLLGIVAAVGAVIGIVALLHRAWRKNWGGIQDATREVLDWLQSGFSQLGKLFGKVWGFFLDRVWASVDAMLQLGAVIERVTKVNLGVGGMREGLEGLFKDLRSGEFIGEAFKFGKSVAQSVGEGLETVKEEWEIILKEMGLDKLGAKVRSLMKGAKPREAKSDGLPTLEQLGYSERKNVTGYALSLEQLMALGNPAKNAPTISSGSATATGRAAPSLLEKLGAVAQRLGDDFARVGEQLRPLGEGLAMFAQGLTSKLGDLGGVIQSVVNGASQGGAAGAIAAAAVELLSRTQAFQALLQTASGALATLVQAFEPIAASLVPPLERILAAVTDALVPVIGALAPVFEMLGNVLDSITPFIVMVGVVLQGLAPVIQVFGMLLKMLFDALGPIIKVLFEVARVVLLVILGFIKVVLDIWNGIIEALASIVETVVNIFTFGAGGKAAGDWVRGAKGDSAGVGAAMKALEDMSWDNASAQAEASAATKRNAAAQVEAAKAAGQVSEALMNVPSGYKIAFARFNADMGLHFEAAAAGGAGAGGGDWTFTGDIYIDTTGDGEETFEEMRKAAKKEAAQRRGNPYARGELDP